MEKFIKKIFMKKRIYLLMILLLTSNILFCLESCNIILNKAVDKRTTQGAYIDQLYNKEIGFEDNIVGGDFKADGKIKNPIIAKSPIEDDITETVRNALVFNNFEVLKKSDKSGLNSIDIEINVFFCVTDQAQTNVPGLPNNKHMSFH